MHPGAQKIKKEEAIRLLKVLLEEYSADLTEWEVGAFTDMAANYEDNGHWLSVVQVNKVKEVYDRVAPQYENLVSSGQVPRGKEVPTPDVLKRENLPLKPPKRKVAEDGSR